MNNENTGDVFVNIPLETDKKQKRKKQRKAISSDSVNSPNSPPVIINMDENTPLTTNTSVGIGIGGSNNIPAVLTRETLQREVDTQLDKQADKFNTYATHKSVSQNLLNTALITQ